MVTVSETSLEVAVKTRMPSGKSSVTRTVVARDGPSLRATRVYVRVEPGAAVAGVPVEAGLVVMVFTTTKSLRN